MINKVLVKLIKERKGVVDQSENEWKFHWRESAINLFSQLISSYFNLKNISKIMRV